MKGGMDLPFNGAVIDDLENGILECRQVSAQLRELPEKEAIATLHSL